MNNNDLLDDLSNAPAHPKHFRLLPFLLELAPLFYVFINGLTQESILYFLLVIPANYLAFSWYFFKASTFKALDIIIAEIAGLSVAIAFVGLLFALESWVGSQLFFYVAIIIQGSLLIYLLYRFSKKRVQDPLEYRFSLKISLRIILFNIILITYLLRFGYIV